MIRVSQTTGKKSENPLKMPRRADKSLRQVELLQRNLAHIFQNIIRKPDESFTKKIEEKIAAVRITDFFREVGDSSECRSQSGVLALQ